LLNALSLVWGVRSFYYDCWKAPIKTISDVNNILKSEDRLSWRCGDIPPLCQLLNKVKPICLK